MSDWSTTDWVGLYGAILASALGLIQWIQWRNSQNMLVLVNTTIHEFGRTDAMTSSVEVTVTNRSNLDVFVHSCWAGYSIRKWTSPWRRETIVAFGPSEIDDQGFITEKQAGYFDLSPGKRAEFHVDRSKLNALAKPSLKLGFCVRKCVAVDHSASANSVFMFNL